jgi:hypothetical protein
MSKLISLEGGAVVVPDQSQIIIIIRTFYEIKKERRGALVVQMLKNF